MKCPVCKAELPKWAKDHGQDNCIVYLQDTNADLLRALQSIMVEYPDMCADANMCDDPHTLGKIERAREAICEAQSH